MNMNKLIVKHQKIADRVLGVHETLFNSHKMGEYINDNNIDGAIVECGIASGSNFAFMMLGDKHNNNGTKRKYYGFDSFCGIPLAGPRDECQPGIGKITHNVYVDERELLKTTGVSSVSKADVIQNLINWELYEDVELIEGWVEDTITDEVVTNINKIALIRLDMDLYSPTKLSLQKLYPILEIGGVLIIDDWELIGVRNAFLEYCKENNLNIEPMLLQNSIADTLPKYFIKRI